ncbi:UDP-N-acetylmuramoyl-L-alanine--D-glutamate ligase [Clostridium tagluense]|uniref:UDP-N-acetylmuramoyl-L-alanine--D-glutamate ligase n=1 Tax=Clostridium TaxID=1485 RepID=UPI0013E95D4A|nr:MULTISPECIES: UDP-N-acetylmuramoyl-L-alanine--D-glutamate ligase [Clostridium]MBU3129204.1 UDP-N-acetylmuramoyl-L-alanine--D-glutamate ligase [Clostridium tagluense]MBW9156281.1 UDP-N-acetylmuramoyl-L-alanine--D-glutamate ligase [Clostridium tagluense]MBZ9625729.1 UDP-N-acetylmuramoyl-L-alanine--D-glutamate ligase [Clostridium sp. FP2]MCB2314242.1 UDP-N-acetylmuramoyl-L-alanine--D-glutamate ligase [Clostridium tagluense]MCB2319107.1 UDP-N-acetylmuramoyl-L-alanine--D-glutamate ligase [Clostr
MKKNFSEFKEFIKGKKVGVVGIGVSNIPLIGFLVELQAVVTAFDKKTYSLLGTVATDFEKKGVKLVLGEHYLDDLTGFDVIFKTPSIRIDNPALLKAKQEGTYITSEMEEFIKYCPAKIFGVTGSDGKTTTTTIIYNILKEEGYKTWVGGNIGTPLFANIQQISKDDKVVLELSSFQLMTMTVSTDVAVVTNLSPNHLDIHKDMEEYIDAKRNIFKYQNKEGILILNKDNTLTYELRKEAKGKVKCFSLKEKLKDGAYFENDKLFIMNKEVCSRAEIKIKGIHNVANMLTAFCATEDEVSVESMREVATTFMGVPHRGEFVREVDGVKYYNDSIASSPTRTIASIKAFEKPVILIAGGYDKQIPFEPLAEQGYSNIKTLILVGDTKYKIKEVFDCIIKEKKISLEIILAEDFNEAIYKAKEIARPNDIVTLSPACASFDMFENFEVRGNKYKEIIMLL